MAYSLGRTVANVYFCSVNLSHLRPNVFSSIYTLMQNLISPNTPMSWERLVSDKRLGMEECHNTRPHIRSDFRRDYDRLIFSSPFRRLQNKTQVFPLPGSIFVHNRLTHSLEVSSVGRSMANEAALLLDVPGGAGEALRHIGDIVATACLSHDLGNPPFGHSGEKTISTFFTEGQGLLLRPLLSEQEWADVANFEGNANSFRLLTHQFQGRREGGLAMTYSTLAATVKYPYPSTLAGEKGKFGFFASEEATYLKVAAELGIGRNADGRWWRHPLVYLMEAADDICYQIMDIEDAHRLGILPTAQVRNLFLAFFRPDEQSRMERALLHLTDPNEQVGYLRSNVIGALVSGCATVFADSQNEILRGAFAGSLIESLPPLLSDAYRACSDTAFGVIYVAPEVVDVEIAGNRIINYLMSNLVEAVMHPERNFSRLLLSQVPRQYNMTGHDTYSRLQGVLDHISGMTDVYALDLFRKLNGHSLPAV